MPVVIAIDAGTTGVRSFALRADGTPGRLRLPRVPPALPRPRPGRARPRRDLGGHRGDAGRAGRPARRRAGGRRRHHQPARDGRGVGPAHRPARCTGRSSGRTGAPPPAATSCARPGTSTWCAAPPAWCSTPTSRPPSSSGCCSRGRRRRRARPGLRHRRRWVLWNLTGGPTAGCTPPSRRTPAARCCSTSTRLAWAPELTDLFGVPAGCLPEVRPSGGRFGVTAAGGAAARRRAGRRASSATSRPPCSARPASSRA